MRGSLADRLGRFSQLLLPLSRYKPPTSASHAHRPHSFSDAAGLPAHYFQDVTPEHPLDGPYACGCVCVCVRASQCSVSAVYAV